MKQAASSSQVRTKPSILEPRAVTIWKEKEAETPVKLCLLPLSCSSSPYAEETVTKTPRHWGGPNIPMMAAALAEERQ